MELLNLWLALCLPQAGMLIYFPLIFRFVFVLKIVEQKKKDFLFPSETRKENHSISKKLKKSTVWFKESIYYAFKISLFDQFILLFSVFSRATCLKNHHKDCLFSLQIQPTTTVHSSLSHQVSILFRNHIFIRMLSFFSSLPNKKQTNKKDCFQSQTKTKKQTRKHFFFQI